MEICQQFVVKCPENNNNKHIKTPNCAYGACRSRCAQIEHMKEKSRCHMHNDENNEGVEGHEETNSPMYGKKPPGTWAEVRLIDAAPGDPATNSLGLYSQIKKILTGLESSMTYLLGQERRRRLKGKSTHNVTFTP